MSEEEILREIARLLARRKSPSEMIAEFLREISVLLFVFAPLDALFSPGTLPLWVIAAFMCAAVALGYVGMRIEEATRR